MEAAKVHRHLKSAKGSHSLAEKMMFIAFHSYFDLYVHT